jgi:heptosyltransferase-1
LQIGGAPLCRAEAIVGARAAPDSGTARHAGHELSNTLTSEILFIKTSSLGDVVHQMPALTEARRARPDARFSWVVEEAFAPLAALHPAVSEVIPVGWRRWRRSIWAPRTWREILNFLRTLRKRGYDEIVDTQGLFFKSALTARLAHGRRHGFDAGSIRERAASGLYDVRHRVARDLHAIARNRALTGLALGYLPEGAIDFGLSRDGLDGTSARPYGIFLHATARSEKEWPEASWVALGRAIERRNAVLVLPWGTEQERKRSERIAAALDGAVVPDRQPLDRVARLIAGASFVIGVDTGLLHLAAALGVPLVAIFVGSERALTGPIGQGPIVLVGGKSEIPSAAEVAAAIEQVQRAPQVTSHQPR